MKAAIEVRTYSDLAARSRETAVVYDKLAGLLLAVGFPTLFWVLLLLLVSNAVGASVTASAVMGVGLAVAVVCFVATSLVTRNIECTSSGRAPVA